MDITKERREVKKVIYHKKVVSKFFRDRNLCNMGKYYYAELSKIHWKYVTCKNCKNIGRNK